MTDLDDSNTAKKPAGPTGSPRQTFVAPAPAKLNLFLEILGKRPDGFHEIETLMAPISICDTLYLTPTDEPEITLSTCWANAANGDTLGDLPSGDDNIVVRAVKLLQKTAGITQGARVRLIKRIPSAAGLGGASSDAAIVLALANQAWGLNWPRRRLAEVAAELGSDIPFFLYDGWAICRGRGERIEEVNSPMRLHLVVVRPKIGLSTPEVYGEYEPAHQHIPIGEMERAVRCGDVNGVATNMVNRLQAPASRLSTVVEQLAALFKQQNILGQLSGSGTSYFGLCRNARHARRVAARLRSQQPGTVFSTVTLPSASRAGGMPD